MHVSVSAKNSKMLSVASVSLLPIVDCGAAAQHCGVKCYARKMMTYRPNCGDAWSRNSILARTDPDRYFAEIADWIRRRRKPVSMFRFHVSGDFLDQDYVDRACKLAAAFPSIRFLAFTKRFDLDYADRPDNFAIVFSAWPTMDVPPRIDGIAVAWMQDGSETRIPDTAITCHGGCEHCGMCWSAGKIGMDVVLPEH